MNKKFTFMVAALLAAGTFSSVHAETLEGAAGNGKYYKLLRSAQYENPNGGTASNWADIIAGTNDMYLALDAEGKLTMSYTMPEDIDEALWKVEKGSIPGTFVLKNKAGKTLTYNGQSAFYTKDLKNIASSSDDAFSINLKEGGVNNLAMDYDTNNANAKHEAGWGLTVDGTSYDLAFDLVAADPTSEDEVIKALNATMGGDGFTLAPANDKVVVDDANNIFSTQVKAIKIASAITDATSNETIPAGTYLVASESAPDAITSMEDFNDLDFVAVSASENYATSKVNKYGLKLVIVNGADLNKFTEADKVAKGAEINVNNATFTLAEPDSYTNPGEYTITAAKVFMKEEGKDSQKDQGALTIGVTKISGVNYVTTTDENVSFKVGQGTLEEVINLVKEEKAPSVFTMEFLSKEGVKDSEYGKFLGGLNAAQSDVDAPCLTIQGEALVDLALPQYQFVISDIDTDKQTVTFSNVERKNISFTTSLYKTDEENVYKIATDPTSTVWVADDEAKSIVNYTCTPINGMIVKLTPVELDTYAGFAKMAVNNNTPYKLAFAMTDAAEEKLYVAMNEKDTKGVQTTLAEESDLQVIFEPVVEADGDVAENVIKGTYAYKKGETEHHASGDMVIYYTYKMRVVDSEDNNYITVGSRSNALEVASSGMEFIAKYRHDGSVALVRKSVGLDDNATMLYADSKTDKAVYGSVKAYAVPNAEDLNLFLEAEKLGVSLAAEPVHVSFQNENGGFMGVNEANEGIIAIANEASEDLTFWLDTTNSDAFIPSFYISKGGKFMYNSTDSAEVNDKYLVKVNANHEAPKAIFKAGELVDSETLKTTVNGKEVTVKATANQNKGIVSGIENFQYNIVKPNDAEDNYVIRSANSTDYLTSVNNVLAFISNKAGAMRVVVETQSAPTSNEGVATSEVKVVANDGSIVVKNAAGKNVVVSTILGQVVANEVLTSDNATINVPAGIVVVAVEGESFKVNVK